MSDASVNMLISIKSNSSMLMHVLMFNWSKGNCCLMLWVAWVEVERILELGCRKRERSQQRR